MDFNKIKNIKIPEGVVILLTTSNGVVLWKKDSDIEYPDYPYPQINEIYYTTTDNQIAKLYFPSYIGDNTLISNTIDENGLGKMVFEKSIESFESNVLSNIFNLRSVILPEGLTKIGVSWFLNDDDLITISIPNSVKTIGNGVFTNCTGLETIKLPEGLTAIGDFGFEYTSSLKYITIPDSVLEIGSACFSHSGIKEIVLPEINIINSNLFEYSGLENIVIPNTVNTIDYGAFYSCYHLKSIELPESITNIGTQCFKDCEYLTEIVSKGLIAPSVANDTFKNVGKYGTLYIYSNAQGYDKWLSEQLTTWNIKYIDIPEEPEEPEPEEPDYNYDHIQPTLPDLPQPKNNEIYYTSTDDHPVRLNSTIYVIGGETFYYKCTSNIYNPTLGYGIITFSKDIQYIGYEWFQGCTTLKSIRFPESIENIHTDVFDGCTSLESVYIPNSCKGQIGSYTFYHCLELKTIILPEGITRIDIYAFYSNKKLEYVDLPSTLTSIANNSFAYCGLIEKFIIRGDNLPSCTINTFHNTSCGYLYCNSTVREKLLNNTYWRKLISANTTFKSLEEL